MSDLTIPDVTIPDAPGPAAAMPAAGAGAAGTRIAGERPWTAARRPRRVAPLPCQLAPDLFFAESPDDLKQAQELCRACPVRQECLAGALERGEPAGVWGGQMFLYGNIIDKKRPRGRPRRVAA
jgi:WhiB family redox-sensing transcriptional regulator